LTFSQKWNRFSVSTQADINVIELRPSPLASISPKSGSIAAQALVGGMSSIYELARGGKKGSAEGEPVGARALFKYRPLVIFLVCAVMFHFANVVTTQLVITVLASWSGRKAGSWGRKPLLLIAFGVLPVRAVLYTLTHHTVALVAIQILDGVGAGIFGVVSVLVIADLTRGTGRFNLTLGAISTAVGIGAALSQTIAGSIVHHFGFDTGFLFLGAIASAAFGILYFSMPETRDTQFPSPNL
jgi:MFS family permease